MTNRNFVALYADTGKFWPAWILYEMQAIRIYHLNGLSDVKAIKASFLCCVRLIYERLKYCYIVIRSFGAKMYGILAKWNNWTSHFQCELLYKVWDPGQRGIQRILSYANWSLLEEESLYQRIDGYICYASTISINGIDQID